MKEEMGITYSTLKNHFSIFNATNNDYFCNVYVICDRKKLGKFSFTTVKNIKPEAETQNNKYFIFIGHFRTF